MGEGDQKLGYNFGVALQYTITVLIDLKLIVTCCWYVASTTLQSL